MEMLLLYPMDINTAPTLDTAENIHAAMSDPSISCLVLKVESQLSMINTFARTLIRLPADLGMVTALELHSLLAILMLTDTEI